MNRNIAVITTEFLKKFICEILDEFDGGVDYRIFTYKKSVQRLQMSLKEF